MAERLAIEIGVQRRGDRMKYYWCTKCKKAVQKNSRRLRDGKRGWVCPDCRVGLPRYPIEIIDERPDLEELLND